MHLPIFQLSSSESLQKFIEFWSLQYSFNSDIDYHTFISLAQYNSISIQRLFAWKNGMKLSQLKQKSLDNKIKAKLSIINTFKKSDTIDLEVFKIEFKKVSAVWKIFLLHIIKPNKYPIYDQHIHRAFLFIHKEDWSNISNTSINNKSKEQFYFDRYLPFIESQNINNLKKLDEAFFAFGQFLNTRNYSTLLQ